MAKIEHEPTNIRFYGYQNPDNDKEYLYAEVDHDNYQIHLTVTLGLVTRTRELMKSLSDNGILPNDETVQTENPQMAIFIANKTYNWNCVWPDLKTHIENKLNIYISEEKSEK